MKYSVAVGLAMTIHLALAAPIARRAEGCDPLPANCIESEWLGGCQVCTKFLIEADAAIGRSTRGTSSRASTKAELL